MASPSTSYFSITSDPTINGMTTGYYWFLDSSRELDFSISNGFNGEYWISPGSVAVYYGAALDTISIYANVDFNYLGYYTDPLASVSWGSELNLSLSQTGVLFNNNNSWAMGLFPNSSYNTSLYPGAPGDLYINISSAANNLSSYEPGSQGWFLLLHEIGHTLGLKHPHDDGGTGRPTFTQLGIEWLDKDWATVMSYNDDSAWNDFFWDPASPMILDVLALQYLYGKNLTHNVSDSVYTLTETNYYYTLWDAAGKDTLNASGASGGWEIYLPEISISTLVDTKVGVAAPIGLSSQTLVWLAGDYENVIGSHFADVIEGNLFNNFFTGNGGADTFIFKASGNGLDTISDIAVGDIIQITGASFNGPAIEGNGFSVGFNQIEVARSGGITTLSIGTDNALGAEIAISLIGNYSVSQFLASGQNITFSSYNNSTPSGSVSISGTARQNQVLTASNTLADVDGLGTISYQWRSNGTNISGATGSTYTLTQAEVGKAITVVASYTDQLGSAESVTSSATGSVANVNDAPSGSVSISGTARQGQTLTASNTLADIDGLGMITYQWFANGALVSGDGSTYTLYPFDIGKSITVVATYTDLFGNVESMASSATQVVEALLSATYSNSISSVDSIGVSPDGQYLLIKVDGVTQSVPVGSSLGFNGSTVTTSDLTSSITVQPVFRSSGGSNGYALPEVFTGPAALNLDYQLIETADNAVVIGGDTNDFIKVASTNSLGKAVDGGGGDDVIDGGVGSTFISGGSGSNTIFLDGRAPGVSWSTVTDFKFGQDKATIWGWKAGVSKVSTIFTDFNTGGAAGYTGLTLHFENLLPDDAAPGQTNSNFNSITLTGLTLADFGATSLADLNAQISAGTNSHFIVGQTVDAFGEHGYLLLS